MVCWGDPQKPRYSRQEFQFLYSNPNKQVEDIKSYLILKTRGSTRGKKEKLPILEIEYRDHRKQWSIVSVYWEIPKDPFLDYQSINLPFVILLALYCVWGNLLFNR